MTDKWPFPDIMSEFTKRVDEIKDTVSKMTKSTKSSWPFPTGISEPCSDLPEPVTLTATKEGIKFVHFDEGDVICTVAYRPCNPMKGLKMLEIAVAYKHPRDQYNRKIGAQVAAKRFLDGHTICMPLRGKTNEKTYWNLYHAFIVSTDER